MTFSFDIYVTSRMGHAEKVKPLDKLNVDRLPHIRWVHLSYSRQNNYLRS